MICLHSKLLADQMFRVLQERNVEAVAGKHVVESLVQTSLRGVDSHGINLFPHYCRALDGGRVNGTPHLRIEQSAPSTSILDADHAFGHYAGAFAMDHAVKGAHATGMAAVAVRNSTHFGSAAYFALRAAEHGCIGLAFCNADALVKAHNSKDRFFGTNPICFAAPMAREGPYVLDMATSLAAWNKVANASRTGNPIPPNWAFDDEGREVTNATLARSLAPLGGYKGFDLGMMVDILCALLAGGPISKDIPPMYGTPLSTQRNIGHFFVAIDISSFSDPEVFKSRLQDMADRVRALPSSPDADDIVMVAGDPEKRNFLTRTKFGIPIDQEKFSEFIGLSNKFLHTILEK